MRTEDQLLELLKEEIESFRSRFHKLTSELDNTGLALDLDEILDSVDIERFEDIVSNYKEN